MVEGSTRCLPISFATFDGEHLPSHKAGLKLLAKHWHQQGCKTLHYKPITVLQFEGLEQLLVDIQHRPNRTSRAAAKVEKSSFKLWPPLWA